MAHYATRSLRQRLVNAEAGMGHISDAQASFLYPTNLGQRARNENEQIQPRHRAELSVKYYPPFSASFSLQGVIYIADGNSLINKKDQTS